ncbi:hypothetical protein N7504_007381 [Penicillium tannophilum]|nr:hypothetical protein N7504_007381 [Penicillium tannophilum]
MSSILTTVGLRATPGEQVPNHAATLLLANWALAYGLMSTRLTKIYYGIDNNIAPREDLATFGEAAVKAGKLDRRTLNNLKLFTAAYAGVPSETINTIGVWYTLSRIAYSLCYTYIEKKSLSYLRSVTWWSGNISCITGLALAAKKL